jgi:hypothetical protein
MCTDVLMSQCDDVAIFWKAVNNHYNGRYGKPSMKFMEISAQMFCGTSNGNATQPAQSTCHVLSSVVRRSLWTSSF